MKDGDWAAFAKECPEAVEEIEFRANLAEAASLERLGDSRSSEQTLRLRELRRALGGVQLCVRKRTV